MPAYNKGNLSIEAYLVRVLAALCRQNGGELRIKGELVDTVGEATALMKSWDTVKQELVLTVSMGSFSEVFRVVPERQTSPQLVLPNIPTEQPEPTKDQPSRVGSTFLDDDKLNTLEKKLQKRRIASMLADEIKRNKRGAEA